MLRYGIFRGGGGAPGGLRSPGVPEGDLLCVAGARGSSSYGGGGSDGRRLVFDMAVLMGLPYYRTRNCSCEMEVRAVTPVTSHEHLNRDGASAGIQRH